MQQITNIRKLTGFLLLACIVHACHSATVTSTTPLMCYVCENCAKITKETPLVACDAEFFEQSSTTLATTTELSTTITAEPTTDSTTTTTLGTTLATTTTGTTAGSTTEAVPTAPTVGPPVTVPTPPTVGTVAADFLLTTEVTVSNNSTEATVGNNTTESTVAYEAPKALQLVGDSYTYHCFSVQKNVNGSAQMDRGCSRVTTMESVCGQLKAQNNGTEVSKCVPCSNNSCNGSSALGISLGVLMFTLIAALLSRQ
ncbi:mucin-3A [Bactrocera dorsalis]|uniref:Mucin-3A n=2 Tax=Endopterygota TaxID=33392 RepID=A0A034WQ73_BACDO|nr:mucin-3A [Bactrocera dorsalis]